MMSTERNEHHPQSRTPQIPSRSKQKHGRGEPRAHTHLKEFFSTYSLQFDYNPTRSASHEFYRLCDKLGWDREDPEREVAYRKFQDALVKQFNVIYGTEDDLDQWQNFCHVVNVHPIPDDLKGCRKAIRGTHVNLVDLVDRNVTGKKVQRFESERALSKYTQFEGKFFPKENAYAGTFLRYLLRHILDPAERVQVPSRHRIRKRR